MISLSKQVRSKLLTGILDGVSNFPTSTVEANKIPAQSGISACTRCALSERRQRVVVAESFAPKKIFILADFPDHDDESDQNVFSKNSQSSALLIKLLDKLNITQDAHFSFALKCYPERGIPDNALQTCARHNLQRELDAVAPQLVVCFGHRANEALQFTTYKQQYLNLPSARELKDFPYWRTQVWQTITATLSSV